MDLKFFLTNKLFHDFVFTMFLYFIIFIIFIFGVKFVQKKSLNNSLINYDLIRKVTAPIYLLIWILFVVSLIFLGMVFIGEKSTISGQIIKYIPSFRSLSITIFVAASLFTFIKQFQKNYIANLRSKGISPDLQEIDLISKLCIIFLLIGTIISLMQVFGIAFGAIAAVGGLGGLVITFAAKDLFANFFGLFSVYIDKPFVIGDDITILEKNINGAVEEIGLRTTMIRTNTSKTAVYIPNSIFNTMIIENNSRMVNRVFEETFKISNTNNFNQILEVAKTLQDKIHGLSFIEKSFIPRLKIQNPNNYSISLNVRANFAAMTINDFVLNSNELMKVVFEVFISENLKILPNEDRMLFDVNLVRKPEKAN